jgi:cell division protease FtsH
MTDFPDNKKPLHFGPPTPRDKRGNRDKRGGDGSGKDPMQWRGAGRTVLFWVALFLVFAVLVSLWGNLSRDAVEINYTEFMKEVENGNVAEVTFTDRSIQGLLRDPKTFPSANTPNAFTKFTTRIPFADTNYELVNRLYRSDVRIIAKDQSPSIFHYLATIGPWLLLILIWLFFIRQMQGGGGGPRGLFSFGKSKAKLLTDEHPKVTFGDVAGADEAKEELQEIIEFLKEPGKFQKLGGKIPKGALLLGPPGTGKTLLARAVAGEAGVPFFSMSGSDFVEMFVGVGASRVRDLFDQGKRNAPCIIFIDEIDAVGRHRGAGLGGGHDEREQTLNQLLVEMDGFSANEGVILVAATNRPDVLDPALLRPGRFDRQIVVGTPDVNGRKGILDVHTRKIKMSEDVDLEVLARGTPGMSGADLANMVNEAALLASRRDRESVTMDDFEEAKDKVLMGSARRSMVISDREKEMTAYHEAGHALAAKFQKDFDPIHKVTIIPRGMALGVTQALPMDERHTYPREYLEKMLVFMMGGRVAEMLVFNHYTTGAGNDLERATKLARKMVCNWGMSDKLGPVTFGKTDEHVFLGKEMAQSKDYSEATAQVIDSEIRRIIEEAEDKATRTLSENIDKLHALARALLERETVDSREVDEIIGTTPGDPEEIETPAPPPKV